MTAAKHSHLDGGGPSSPLVTISLYKRRFHGGVVQIEFPLRIQMFFPFPILSTGSKMEVIPLVLRTHTCVTPPIVSPQYANNQHTHSHSENRSSIDFPWTHSRPAFHRLIPPSYSPPLLRSLLSFPSFSPPLH